MTHILRLLAFLAFSGVFSCVAFSAEEKILEEVVNAPQVQETFVTRRAFAERMLAYFEIPPSWTLTEISPFRDLTPQSRDYPLLETAWQYQILLPRTGWYLRPNAILTEIEAWQGLKGFLLTQYTLKDEYNLALLAEDETFKRLTSSQQKDLVVLYESYLLDVFEDLPIEPDAPVSEAWLNTLMARIPDAQRLLKTDVKRGLSATPWRLLPTLPADLNLVISPQEAIIGTDLKIGQTLYFRLLVPIYPTNTDVLVEESSLAGRIVELQILPENPSVFRVKLELSTLRNGHSNTLWKLKAFVKFDVSNQSELPTSVIDGNENNSTIPNFILPTEVFNIKTLDVEAP
jgi:hypothetical protein